MYANPCFKLFYATLCSANPCFKLFYATLCSANSCFKLFYAPLCSANPCFKLFYATLCSANPCFKLFSAPRMYANLCFKLFSAPCMYINHWLLITILRLHRLPKRYKITSIKNLYFHQCNHFLFSGCLWYTQISSIPIPYRKKNILPCCN